jgi:hypothetical protein
MCIFDFVATNDDFTCPLCDQVHSKNDKFTVNRKLLQMVETHAGNACETGRLPQLREKLESVKQKSEKFELNLSKGLYELNEHCQQLRNQVHLQTEYIIEQVHQNNEALISKIDEYEKECTKSFDLKFKPYNLQKSQLLSEINTFGSISSSYFSGNEISVNQVSNSLVKSDGYLQQLDKEEANFKEFTFCGEPLAFIKNHVVGQNFVGSLVHKQLKAGVFNEVSLKNLANLKTYFFIFKLDNGNNVAFYIDKSNDLCVKYFDNQGVLTQDVLKPLDEKIFSLSIAATSNGFIMFVGFPNSPTRLITSFSFMGKQLRAADGLALQGFMFRIDFNLKSLHYNLRSYFTPYLIASNDSYVYVVDRFYNHKILDSNFVYLSKPLDTLRMQVTNTVIDLAMNNTTIFFLCNDRTLKTFSATCPFAFEKVIDTNANQLKLAYADYLLLFDSRTCILSRYDLERNKHDKLDEVDLKESIQPGSWMSKDLTKYICFYNFKSLNYNLLK